MAFALSPADYPQALTRALVAAGIPVRGVSLGDLSNRATWRVDYAPEATAQQRIDGDALKLALTLTDPAVLAREQALIAQAEVVSNRVIQALAVAIHKRMRAVVPADTTTPAQWAASIRAEWDALQ